MVSVNGAATVSEDEAVVRESAEAAVGAIRQVSEPPPDHVLLSNGITLKLKSVPPLLVRRAATQVAKPKVPMWKNPDRDGREEENPNDPDYLDALDRYDESVSLAALNVLFIVGTKIEQPIPEGAIGPESDEWIAELEFVGVEVKKEGLGRYLDWLKYSALANTGDLVSVSVAVGRMSGLQEQDVSAALNSFRRGEARGADSEPDPENAGDGDRVPAVPAGDSAGD